MPKIFRVLSITSEMPKSHLTVTTPLRGVGRKADLLNRLSALRTKGQALTKQVTAYEKAARPIKDDDGEPLFEVPGRLNSRQPSKDQVCRGA